MAFDFDTVIDRRNTDSGKWRYYEPDVLPMWVADMDFRSPPAVIQALRERVEHGVFGYPLPLPGLVDAVMERLERLYGWKVSPDAVKIIPGVVTGFTMACFALGQPGDEVLVQPPVYMPFLSAPGEAGLTRVDNCLLRLRDGSYAVDYDDFERQISARTRAFILCNPHNPVGRVFSRDELSRMAEICLRHGVTIVSDEIHCDLLLDGRKHTPLASLDESIAAHTITLMAPSKTYNIAGLQCSIAIIPDAELRRAFCHADKGLIHFVNVLGQVAAEAAYRGGQDWLDELLVYLQANRDHLARRVQADLPGVRVSNAEATYLAWLDCTQAGTGLKPAEFFHQHARVGLNEGDTFGPGGESFVRLNFGCPRALLDEGIDRMAEALRKFAFESAEESR